MVPRRNGELLVLYKDSGSGTGIHGGFSLGKPGSGFLVILCLDPKEVR